MKKNEIYTEISIDDEEYPKKLLDLNDPPDRLFCLGDIKMLKRRSVAIVGSRTTTKYGQWAAKAISKKVSQHNIAVVSGMALGIDTYAHMAALEEIGSTIAVLGCGIDRCYPARSWRLKDEIRNKGLVISEYPMGTAPQKWTFPLSNRIVAALSEIVVVVEAGNNSGALITAERAVEISREVMAVPGNINSMQSMGTNKLILDGATPVIVVKDILEALNVTEHIETNHIIGLGELEKIVYNAVRNSGECTVADICDVTGKDVRTVNSTITVLEMKGLLQTAIGKVFVAK